MNKKVTWGIIALIAVILIFGIVWVINNEEGEGSVQQENIAEESAWDAQDKLLEAYNKIDKKSNELSEEEFEDLMDRYNNLESALYDLEDGYFDERLSEEEFQEGLTNFTNEIEIFIDEIENKEQVE